MQVENIPAGKQYFALRSFDAASNRSGVGNMAEVDVRWETAYGFGPRATPTACGDRIYALGAMGDLWCLESTRLRRRRWVPVQLRRPEGQHEMSQPLTTMAMIPTGRPTRGGGRFRRER
jgi:hypothetical protein